MHTQFGEQLLELGDLLGHFSLFLAYWRTAQCYVVQKTAWGAIWRVHWASKAPRLRKKFAHRSCLHLCEVLASVNRAEVRQIARCVELVWYNCETSCLL